MLTLSELLPDISVLVRRLARREKKAAIAVTHRLMIIAWHIIDEGTVCRELGGNHHDRLHPDRSARRLIRRLEQIGLEVSAIPKAAEIAPVPEAATPAVSPGERKPPVSMNQTQSAASSN